MRPLDVGMVFILFWNQGTDGSISDSAHSVGHNTHGRDARGGSIPHDGARSGGTLRPRSGCPTTGCRSPLFSRSMPFPPFRPKTLLVEAWLGFLPTSLRLSSGLFDERTVGKITRGRHPDAEHRGSLFRALVLWQEDFVDRETGATGLPLQIPAPRTGKRGTPPNGELTSIPVGIRSEERVSSPQIGRLFPVLVPAAGVDCTWRRGRSGSRTPS